MASTESAYFAQLTAAYIYIHFISCIYLTQRDYCIKHDVQACFVQNAWLWAYGTSSFWRTLRSVFIQPAYARSRFAQGTIAR